MTGMTQWVETIPAFVVLTVVLFLPGWLVVRALGSRGLEALAVSPAVSVGLIAAAATVAQRVGIAWGLATLAVVTLLAFAAAWGVGLLVGRLPLRWAGTRAPTVSPSRRLLGRPRPDVVGAIAIGVLIALVTILPAIGRPDELVDSPDAVYHLNRIALFLDTGNFSIANPTFYPNGFHAWVATSLLPGVADVLPGTNVATVVLAAVVWPVGCVALVRHALGSSRLVTYAGGLASAAFVSFPTILLGWGVLWPNLMATALTPGALALMLQAARSRRVGQWLGFAAALPGLALIQPNALVALVVFALVWFGSARMRAGLLGHLGWWAVARDLAILTAAVAVGLLIAPVVSARLASTQSYQWNDRVTTWTALVEVVGGRLQIPHVLWGLLALIVLGIGWVVMRARAALPVVAMWLACVVLYVMAASSTASWTALITGYWYNDKVRLASLAAVPGVVLVAAAAPALRALLSKLPPLRTRPMVAAALALSVLPLSTVVLDAPTRSDFLSSFFRPDAPHKVILSFEAQDSLREIARLIPPGEGVVGRPENGTPLMFALFGTDTLYRSIPIPTTGDEIVIGTGFNDLVNRPDVCAALARHNVRWAIDSPHTYWLDRPERTSGLTDLDTVEGLEKVKTVGDYTLYRITGC
ncbi:hypothetical protein FBY41_2642 [Humibacillus xanthopallidus]|uniref:4-amino-4-deoxy-L-arabinose transferase-like glycosyltransferase n=2 Tax=Humibacillus xanthopallidus TaxID=412689 RepID=A0A543HWA6_9MICO|nr:hypothetical protein FBY41_2642 [Humibacillus xanthopallidus]